MLDPSVVVDSLLENLDDFISLEEIEAGWKKWRECTTEEWLKGADGGFCNLRVDETHLFARTC